MENVTFISVENPDGSTTEHAIIDRGNGEFTSMPKSVYDTLPSNSSIPQAGE
jgi:predicted aspartyl protease